MLQGSVGADGVQPRASPHNWSSPASSLSQHIHHGTSAHVAFCPAVVRVNGIAVIQNISSPSPMPSEPASAPILTGIVTVCAQSHLLIAEGPKRTVGNLPRVAQCLISRPVSFPLQCISFQQGGACLPSHAAARQRPLRWKERNDFEF